MKNNTLVLLTQNEVNYVSGGWIGGAVAAGVAVASEAYLASKIGPRKAARIGAATIAYSIIDVGVNLAFDSIGSVEESLSLFAKDMCSLATLEAAGMMCFQRWLLKHSMIRRMLGA